MKDRSRKLWKGGLVASLVASLFLSSGCALLVVGAAAGTGGYLIRKGEEGDSSKKKEISEPEKKSSSEKKAEQKLAFVSGEEAGWKLVLQVGGSR